MFTYTNKILKKPIFYLLF